MEEKKIKRKLKWQLKLIIYIILIIIYAIFIGTKGIFIKEYKINADNISNNIDGLKIAHFSDLHYGSSLKNDGLTKVIDKINSTKPDIVIFTGGLLNNKYNLKDKDIKNIIDNLSNIKSNLGKYYITSKEDSKEAVNILNSSSFISLDDNESLIYNMSYDPIVLLGKNNVNKYFEENKETNFFTLLAIHNPDDINKYKNNKINMTIAGHTHNGQINIPKIKNLLIDSKYKNNYQKVGNTELFINPGIGTKKVNIRLFNHPTIYLYRLNKTSLN